MNRRELLKIGAGAAVGVALGRSHPQASVSGGKMDLKPGPQTRVCLSGATRGASENDIKKAVRAAAESATDFSWLGKGDAVFIKPALNSGKPYPATTSPTAIAAIIELLREKGAGKVIIGDMSGIEHVKLEKNGLRGSSRSLMQSSGMAEAAVAAGGELHFFEEAGWNAFYEEEPAPGSHWKRSITMPNVLKTVDHIILMPRVARHVLAGSTLALKNAVGYWRTDTRFEYHYDAETLHEKTAEGNTVPTLRDKQRLTITAADKILSTIGPDQGLAYEPDVGLVIASESVTAHDMTVLAWLFDIRKRIPAGDSSGFLDNSPLFAALANRWVVDKLDGLSSAFTAEPLTKNKLETIWDDRVLNRAYEVFGGIPVIEFSVAAGNIPESLLRSLKEMTTPSV